MIATVKIKQTDPHPEDLNSGYPWYRIGGVAITVHVENMVPHRKCGGRAFLLTEETVHKIHRLVQGKDFSGLHPPIWICEHAIEIGD